MKSILLLLLVFANMGFTVAGKSFQQPNAGLPELSHSSIQDGIIVASPDANRIIMN